METITICICTRQRQDGLRVCLESLTKIHVPANVSLMVQVVENDTHTFTKELVSSFSDRLRTKYYLETSAGIVFARNRHLQEAKDSDIIIFLDDDQYVDADWLIEMLKCKDQYGASAVFNNLKVVGFDALTKPSVKKFFTPQWIDSDLQMSCSGAGGLLLDNKKIRELNLSFDFEFNLSGGEDLFFTKQLVFAGLTMYNSSKAICYEVMHGTRLNLSTMLKRCMAHGRNESKIVRLRGLSREKRTFFLKVLKRQASTIIELRFIFVNSEKKYNSILNIAYTCGVLFELIGRSTSVYKTIDN